jgi:SAM-dependent methyltransferase
VGFGMIPQFQCRACRGTRGALILDLGVQPLANNLLSPGDLSKAEPKFPLRLAVCEFCWLLQILDIIPPTRLFSDYPYFSSFSETTLIHAREAAERYIREFSLGRDSLVVEVASNDGYLLQNFTRAGVPCLGIEPAENIAPIARQKGIETLVMFFNTQTARQLAITRGQADLILGNNVFAHVPDINDFVASVAVMLKPQGRCILEFPYAVDFIEKAEFDTIYHEHVFYFSVTALAPLFVRHGLTISHVERLPIHGGSLRLFVARAGSQTGDSTMEKMLADEERLGLRSLESYAGFAERVRQIRQDLCGLLGKLKAQGKSIAAYGASAKGSTLLNYFGLGHETIDYVVDRSTYKQGRLTPGAHLPIRVVEELVQRQPDYTLLLTWNFAEEILLQQAEYRRRGGKFIVPIPAVVVV